jgi:hypothetical protein
MPPAVRHLVALLPVLLVVTSCRDSGRSNVASPDGNSSPPPSALQLTGTPIGKPASRPPWIAHVASVDLDRDGRVDILACEAQENQILWLRQIAPGQFEESVIASDLRAPVRVEPADLDADGDIDLLVASMGFVFPNNDRIGTVFLLENDGRQNFAVRPLVEHTDRVTDVRAADLNGDGHLDVALAQFGYDQGSVAWLERIAPGQFRRHVLLELSGAINVCIADFNGDGKPDLAALLSQQWEEVHLFENTGGAFTRKRVWASTNEDYGSSGLSVADLNADGRPDLLFSNGDGFGPAAIPGPRPWHGVQWLENLGTGSYRFHRLGDLPGAYSPAAVDLDSDGALDVVAVAAYAGRNNPAARVISLVWFRNVGGSRFERHVLALDPRDQLTVAVGDFDNSGQPSLVTGGFYLGPAPAPVGRFTLWRR